jgi:glycerol-3-phosphate dehydrogenase
MPTATTVIANYTDAANKSKNEFTTIVTAFRVETRKDAKAMKLGAKKL